ncbi:conserved hypothetical protein [Trichinella spiralis]|uniref:hypothetical protein n=1 Tax=Trichinella spiralis TaxID=6334 RepID=UPI0001EFD8A5|nr:conserved hypothetical protein [Trichinella spiralis]
MVSRLLIESGCLRLQPKAGGKSHPRLNIRTRPIANKYREGKESSTGRETVDRQTDGADGAILTKISRRWIIFRFESTHGALLVDQRHEQRSQMFCCPKDVLFCGF